MEGDPWKPILLMKEKACDEISCRWWFILIKLTTYIIIMNVETSKSLRIVMPGKWNYLRIFFFFVYICIV